MPSLEQWCQIDWGAVGSLLSAAVAAWAALSARRAAEASRATADTANKIALYPFQHDFLAGVYENLKTPPGHAWLKDFEGLRAKRAKLLFPRGAVVMALTEIDKWGEKHRLPPPPPTTPSNDYAAKVEERKSDWERDKDALIEKLKGAEEEELSLRMGE